MIKEYITGYIIPLSLHHIHIAERAMKEHRSYLNATHTTDTVPFPSVIKLSDYPLYTVLQHIKPLEEIYKRYDTIGFRDTIELLDSAGKDITHTLQIQKQGAVSFAYFRDQEENEWVITLYKEEHNDEYYPLYLLDKQIHKNITNTLIYFHNTPT